MFWKLSDTVRLYLAAPPPPPKPPIMPPRMPSPPPPGPCAPPPPGMAAPIVGPPFALGPPPPRLLVSVAVLSPAFCDAEALLAASPPKPNVRLTVRLTDSEPGPCPKFRGMICSPGLGTRLKFPNRVQRMLMLVQSALAPAKLGRSLAIRSRFVSRPVVMLKGGPELAVMNGLKTSFHQGAFMVPTRLNECRMSKDARDHSPVKSYELTGNPPSASLFVLLKLYEPCNERPGLRRLLNPTNIRF